MSFLKFSLAVYAAIFAVTSVWSKQGQSKDNDLRTSKLSKDFTLVETSKYSIEVPDGWTVGKQTPWGARTITPNQGRGEFGAMTAGPSKDGWDKLYQTSLFYIKREEPGVETPYVVGRTKQGYECISFDVKDSSGFAARRYTLIRDSKGYVLALSIKIPSPSLEKVFVAQFQHMVDTAKIRS